MKKGILCKNEKELIKALRFFEKKGFSKNINKIDFEYFKRKGHECIVVTVCNNLICTEGVYFPPYINNILKNYKFIRSNIIDEVEI